MDFYKQRQYFLKQNNLSQSDFEKLVNLWHTYGMHSIDKTKSNKANHYFLQGLVEHNINEWDIWYKDLHPDLNAIIKSEFPQLCV